LQSVIDQRLHQTIASGTDILSDRHHVRIRAVRDRRDLFADFGMNDVHGIKPSVQLLPQIRALADGRLERGKIGVKPSRDRLDGPEGRARAQPGYRLGKSASVGGNMPTMAR
jgi:hypothetical protein